MLKPTKYMDLDLCVVNISSELIKLLSKNNVMEYNEVINYLLQKFGKNIKPVFIPTINFLYLIGKMEYHPSIDSFEFIS